MERNQAEQALFYAMTIGERLLINGAEVSRVEDTIRRIGMAYGAERVDVFSITSSIVTTLYYGGCASVTQTRRVSGSSNDFDAIDSLNQLSRTICQNAPIARMDRFGASRNQRAEALFARGADRHLRSDLGGVYPVFRRRRNGYAHLRRNRRHCSGCLKRRSNLPRSIGCLRRFCSALPAVWRRTCACWRRSGIIRILISIGNIMLFVPGIAFTNSLRDLFSGETITGLIRFFESLLLAILLALGFALANLMF